MFRLIVIFSYFNCKHSSYSSITQVFAVYCTWKARTQWINPNFFSRSFYN